MNVLADFIHNRLAALCEYFFIFCDQIITMGIDRDDERAKLFDAPRDKCAHFREINGIAAAFQYLQKNYIPTALSFL